MLWELQNLEEQNPKRIYHQRKILNSFDLENSDYVFYPFRRKIADGLLRSTEVIKSEAYKQRRGR